jgi:hypothetical protein
VLLVVFIMVATMFVVPLATLVAHPLMVTLLVIHPLPLRPVLIVATFVLDEVQVTAWVRSFAGVPDPLA